MVTQSIPISETALFCPSSLTCNAIKLSLCSTVDCPNSKPKPLRQTFVTRRCTTYWISLRAVIVNPAQEQKESHTTFTQREKIRECVSFEITLTPVCANKNSIFTQPWTNFSFWDGRLAIACYKVFVVCRGRLPQGLRLKGLVCYQLLQKEDKIPV